MNKKTKTKGYYALLFVSFFLLFIGFAYSQLFKTDYEYQKYVENIIDRGYIYFSNKDNENIIVSRSIYKNNLAINPSRVKEFDELAFDLIKYVLSDEEAKIFEEEVNRGLYLPSKKYKVILKDLSKERKGEIQNTITDKNLTSLFIERVPVRLYPYSELGASVLGFISFNKKSGVREGAYGIERSFNNELANGADIKLTIDIELQQGLEEILTETQVRLDSKKTGGIIINPNNGKILAMASIPSFDLNEFQSVEDKEVFVNSNIENVFEFGSVFKPVTLAIGLDSKKVNINDVYHDYGSVKVEDRTIHNYDKKAFGADTTIEKIIGRSLNTGSIHILFKTGIDHFSNHIKQFKLNEKIGIKLPNEANNLVNALNTKNKVNYATISYGHGIALTPISAVKVFSSLANGGRIIVPYLVDQIIIDKDKELKIKHYKNETEHIIFSKNTTKEVTDILVKAFDDYLSGGFFKKKRYSVATKTGTALLLNKKTGEYYDDSTLLSMFGYFPAYKPEYLVFIYTLEPEAEVETASQGLGLTFSLIFDYINSKYNLSVDR